MDSAKILIRLAPLDPDTTAMLCGVLDDLWPSLEPRFTGQAKLLAPLTIANALLHGTATGLRDAAALREHARERAMALLSPDRPDAGIAPERRHDDQEREREGG